MLLHQLLHHNDLGVHFRDIAFYVVCSIIFIVFAALIASMFVFQKSKAQLGVDIIWSVIPLVMLLVMMTPIVNMFIYQQPNAPTVMISALKAGAQ